MSEPWSDPVPEPLDINQLSIVDAVPEHVVPNHYASGTPSTEDKPKRKTVRERLMEATAGKSTVEPRNVRPRKEKRSVPNRPGQFVEPLTDFYNGIAMVVMPFEPELSMTMVSPYKAPTEEEPNPPSVNERCAKAWDEAAQRSESVRRMLDGFLTVNVWGTLIAAHAPILLVLAKNHTPLGAKFSPATAMEDMLRREAS